MSSNSEPKASVDVNEEIRSPKIVYETLNDKPYYLIEYYDPFNKTYCRGYGSYNLDSVKEWLDKNFISVSVDNISQILWKIQKLSESKN